MSFIFNPYRFAATGYVIENSLRFNDNDSAYLSRTFGSAGNTQKAGFSWWVKLGNITQYNSLMHSATGYEYIRFEPDDTIDIVFNGVTTYSTTRKFRDPTAWYNIVVSIDTTQATASDRVKLWINGVAETLTGGTLALNKVFTELNKASAHYWFRHNTAIRYFDGYQAETVFIDGTIEPADVGEFDSNGNWVPVDVSELDFTGTNSFNLNYAIAPGTGFGAGTDVSGGFSLDIIDDTQTYSASSEANGAASNAADGSSGTRWGTATGSGVDNWWSVDLGSGNEKAVIRVEMDFGSDAYTTDLKIYGSDTDAGTGPDAEPATQLYRDATLSLVNATTYSFDFSNNTTAYRYYWVHIDNAGAGNAGVKDFRFYTTGDYGLNHFTESGLAANDRVSDSPTDSANDGIGNYATFNPLILPTTYSNGNLTAATTGNKGTGISTIAITPDDTGKYAAEFTVGAVGSASLIGICTDELVGTDSSGYSYFRGSIGTQYSQNNLNGTISYANDGTIVSLGATDSSAPATYTTGDVIRVEVDRAADTIQFFKGGADQVTIGSLSGRTAFGGNWFFCVGGIANTISANFGQQGFAGTPTSGFVGLNTANLPAPAVKDPSSHVQTELYAGNATDDTAISQSGNSTFQPDHVVVKNRDTTDVWKDIDVVRGATEQLNWDHTTIETTEATGVKSFDSSGFTLGTGANGYNDNTENFLSMMWKLGGTASSNTDGDITSSVSVNSTSGLVRGTYSGSGTNNQTVGHGLGQQPDFLMVKRLDTAGDWVLIADGMGTYGDTNHRFNSRAVVGTGDNVFNDTAPGTSVFTLGDNAATNASGGSYMFWAGYSVAGFSRYGVHEGNGNADGGFVYCGFTPLIVIHELYDTASEQYLWLNDIDVNGDSRNYNNFSAGTTSSTAEASTSTINIDILSNGFKYRGAAAEFSSGSTFTMAWAEHPFGGSGVSQARAR